MSIDIAAVSYATAALAFLFLGVSLLIGSRGRPQGVVLALAGVLSALWAAAAAYGAAGNETAVILVNSLEPARSAAWFAFLLKVLRLPGATAQEDHRSSFQNRLAMSLLAYSLLLVALTIYVHAWSPAEAGQLIFYSDIVGRAVLAVAGLVLVEQLFRNSSAERRWGIKYLCLGLGGMFAYDFFLYSDAMLFRHIDAALWAARGIVDALTVPLIMISAARNPQWELDVHVSRRIAFHSVALLGAGVYLLFMAAAGYYIRVFGGNWGIVLQVAFLFGAATVLLAVFFSGTLRARLRVFLSKHFFHYKYDYREEWLRFTRTLSEGNPGLRLREHSIRAVADLVESPSGALWMSRDGGPFNRVAHWNLPTAEGVEAVDSPFSRYLEQRQWVINLDEYDDQPDLYADLTLPQWLSSIPRAWLIVPLILHEHLLGFMVLERSLGHVTFNWEVSDLLKTAARQAASNLAQMEASDALMVARQFESFNRMTAFVVHDLKNLVAQLSLLLSNAEKHKSNPEFQDDMISTVENSVQRMTRMLTQLRSDNAEAALASVDLGALLQAAIDTKSAYRLKPQLRVEQSGLRVCAERERLLRVVGHIIQNAIEATPHDGKVAVRLKRNGNDAVIEVEDSGSGMDEQFVRERLFRPFDSTKGTGMGIGAYECREYIRELGGQVEVSSVPSKGTTFQLHLPLEANDGKSARAAVGETQG
jgi:putative PEP-CTERM system histidine kinase